MNLEFVDFSHQYSHDYLFHALVVAYYASSFNFNSSRVTHFSWIAEFYHTICLFSWNHCTMFTFKTLQDRWNHRLLLAILTMALYQGSVFKAKVFGINANDLNSNYARRFTWLSSKCCCFHKWLKITDLFGRWVVYTKSCLPHPSWSPRPYRWSHPSHQYPPLHAFSSVYGHYHFTICFHG